MPVNFPEVGTLYHVSWANPGCVWRLHHIFSGGASCQLITPSTGKKLIVKTEDLRYTRKDQEEIEKIIEQSKINM